MMSGSSIQIMNKRMLSYHVSIHQCSKCNNMIRDLSLFTPE